MRPANPWERLSGKKVDTKISAINEIVSRLRTIDPFRIVLFGSLALEMEESESDIDLLVILDSEDIPQTYEQRMKGRLLVRESVQAINKHVAIDLIVYTKGEYQYLQRHGSSFLREIESTGKSLYEKAGYCAAEFGS